MNKSINVLIIDDDEDGRFAFRRFLTQLSGFEANVIEAETGEDGLDKYRSNSFDVVLLDYSLPGISGIDVLEKLKQLDADAPVIMLTGLGDENVAVEVMKLGAVDYLPKDRVSTDSMHRAVTHAIEQTELKRQVRTQRHELETFANVLAHDLKTPLNGVMGFAELLLLKSEETDEYNNIKQEIRFIYQSAHHMNALISSLQQYANGGLELEAHEFDLQEALDQAKNNLATTIAEHKAVIHIDTNIPRIFGCKSQIIQLFQNLIANGIKYCEATTPEIIIRTGDTGDGTVITVKDNGIGIREDQTKDIFTAFSRLHADQEVYEGTGLGLATCKRIVERHNGRIWCTSQLGHGSTFHVYLPAQVNR